jgi:hypothetical protein
MFNFATVMRTRAHGFKLRIPLFGVDAPKSLFTVKAILQIIQLQRNFTLFRKPLVTRLRKKIISFGH